MILDFGQQAYNFALSHTVASRSGRPWTAGFVAAFACTCGSSGACRELASASSGDWELIITCRELTEPVARATDVYPKRWEVTAA